MQSLYTQRMIRANWIPLWDQCKVYTHKTLRTNWIPLDINAKYTQKMPRTNWIHWKSMQTLHRLYIPREHTANWIPLEINAKCIHIEHSESTGIHWRSMQNIYTEDTQKQLDSIGDQCKVYIHTQRNSETTGFNWKPAKNLAESTRSPLFLEISETDCCADYVYYLSNTLLSGSHRRSMLNETLTENARSQSCRPVSGAAVPRLPRGQSMGQGSMAWRWSEQAVQ